MIVSLLLIAVVALLLLATYTDVTMLRIPNLLSLAVAVIAVVFAAVATPSLHDFLMHLLAGVVVIVVGFALFAVGLKFGGGDAKLLAALSIWLGFAALPVFLIVMSLVGGVVAITVFALRHFGIPVWLSAHGWRIPALELDEKKSYVPYAPAMTAAFIYVALATR
jgi:prepilin peptidase CpaA